MGMKFSENMFSARYMYVSITTIYLDLKLKIYIAVCKLEMVVNNYLVFQDMVLPHTIIGSIGISCHLIFQYVFVLHLDWKLE